MLKPGRQVVFTPLSDDEGVLLNLDTKLYYGLNPTAAYLWRLIESEKAQNSENLTAQLQAHFQISEQTAQADVADFLKDLLREQLLEDVR